MNFKPNSWKVISSILIGWLIVPFLFGFFLGLTTGEAEISNDAGVYILAIFGIIITYVIWSLIEKNKK